MEGSPSEVNAVIKAIDGRRPIISRTAIKEFSAKGDMNVLREFLTTHGGRVGKAGSRDLVDRLKRSGIKNKDAIITGSAIRENAKLLTRDEKLLKRVGPIGELF
ncbi:MAG: type II toxin-antitoxin system VapC family toxin [Candidatus Nitronauta litoralis]|uniref:Type II toxin-antitoxin system VapC family toxin n=1 Tax=Candidatus Nitronauta litoralis TaxID=2705533 RepID=A0A7T0BYH2_9BACT|nr:MAG: type II toxin-antitoxin system VapC family toxin [Candidatus Nitronauta litoralis]